MNVRVVEATSELIDARLQTGDAVRFTVPTWSMYPALAPGDCVIVRRARAAEPRVGDLIIVKPDASAAWIVHRLIARREMDGSARAVTKGDNCAAADPPWLETRLIGRVVAVQRQRAAQPIDFTSRRARAANACLALLSRGQAFVEAKTRGKCPDKDPSLTRRGALKVSRWVTRASGFAARWIIGWGV